MYNNMYLKTEDLFDIIKAFRNICGNFDYIFFDNEKNEITIFNYYGLLSIPARNIEWYVDISSDMLELLGMIMKYPYIELCYDEELFPYCDFIGSIEKPDCTPIEIRKCLQLDT